jgi:tetratricopeptide (TPR) repeat protein
MRLLLILLIFTASLTIQARESKELIALLRKGNAQHDVGNYEQALSFYKKALKHDSTSGIVQYEMAYTLLAMKRYDEAAMYSRKVIDLDSKQQQGAYLMLGSALNMSGKIQDAIQVYLEGLTKFRTMHQMHYNLALAYYDIGNLAKSEEALYRSLQMRPGHVNSHLLLGNVLSSRGDNIKSALCYAYVLYLDPEIYNASSIESLLKSKIEALFDSTMGPLRSGMFPGDSIFMMVYDVLNELRQQQFEDNSYSHHTCLFLGSLQSLLDKGHPLWSDLYATTFYGLQNAGHCEAFSYSLASLNTTAETESWMRLNQGKVQEMRSWIDSHQPPQKMNQILFGGKSVLR